MDRPELENYGPLPLKTRPVSRFRSAVWGVIVLLLLIGLGFGYSRSGRSSFCGNCHGSGTYAASRREGPHRTVSCLACHREPGVTGSLTQRLHMLKKASINNLYLSRHRPAAGGGTYSSNCLGCHRDIETGTVLSRRKVRIRHKDMISASLACARCHPDTGHESKAADPGPAHNYCFACHRPEQQAQCSYCHTEDPTTFQLGQIDRYRKTNIGSINDCAGCHPTDACTDCHSEIPKLIEY